jgi:hypothetical protein
MNAGKPYARVSRLLHMKRDILKMTTPFAVVKICPRKAEMEKPISQPGHVQRFCVILYVGLSLHRSQLF